jgi:hypothetical protein
MAQYQMYFATQTGWTNFNVDVDEDEALQSVLPDVLHELEENGYVLQGWQEGSGELVVTWEGRELDLAKAVSLQGLRPNEVLRVTVRAPKPVLQLRRDDEAHDVSAREELREGDDIILGRSILRFHVSQHQERPTENISLLQQFQQIQIVHQTVYYMALVGAIAGLVCAGIVAWIPDLASVGGALLNVINMAVLGGCIGGLTVGCHDYWVADRVVGRWVLVGISVGMMAGVIGGVIHSAMSQPSLSGRLPLLSRALSWMIAGWLIGLGVSLRWVMINKARVLHGLIGGTFGGLLGGIAFWSLKGVNADIAQLLGFVLTGIGITCGVSLAPLLLRQGVLEFVSSGDSSVLEAYGRSHQQWELHDDSKYVIGSLGARTPHTVLTMDRQILIPDKLVAPRHAILVCSTGRYYIEPHSELRMPQPVAARALGG